jgi:hypothetical protein
MQPLSKGFYLGSILGGLIAAIVLFAIGSAVISGGEEAGGALMAIGYLPMIYSMVIVYVLIYKIWAAIQGPTARTTPGKAVGFMFIPIFNIYWLFQVIWGWAKDYNALIAQRGISGPQASEGLGLATCIIALIPCVSVITPILMLIFFNAAIDGANAVMAAGAQAPAVGAPPEPPDM